MLPDGNGKPVTECIPSTKSVVIVVLTLEFEDCDGKQLHCG